MQKKYTIVTCAATLAQLYAHLDEFEYFAYDTETTGLNVRKDKVIGLSVCGKAGVAFYVPLLSWNKTFHCLRPVYVNEQQFSDILIKLRQKDLLMWNGSFDIRVTKNNFSIDLTEALLADVMLMKHTIEEDGEFRLKESAIELAEVLGLDNQEQAANEEQLLLKENVIANGGIWLKSNKEMYKADLEVMGPYACADADITFRHAEYFLKKLEEEELEEFFFDKEVMPLYKLVTIPMEEHGVKLDMPLILSTKEAIKRDMSQLEERILKQLDDLPEVGRWKIEKAKEEFPQKHTGTFAQAFCQHYGLDLPKTPAGKFSLTAKTISKLENSDFKSFLQGSLTLPDIFAEEISWKLFCNRGLDKINISSKQQLGQIVFDCLGIEPLSKTDKGAPQFDDGLIQHLIDVHELDWAKDLSNYNKLLKISSTYIDRFLEAQENGYYYFSYKQHGTISGRYSGDAQQLPRPKEEEELDPIVLKYNNLVRSFFITDVGRSFIDDDYESLEPHVFAHISGDEGLRDIFRNGWDFYSTIAIPTENLQGVSADKKAPNYLGKVNKPARQAAKAYALGVPYGMEEYALHKSLNCTKKQAAEKIENYLGGFPALRRWMEDSEEFVKENGYIRTESGRIRHLPKVKEIYEKHGDSLLDWRYKKDLISKLSKRMPYQEAKDTVTNLYRDYKNGLNNAKNVQVQGLGASIVNQACIAVAKEFKKLGINGYVCAQIHDQAIFDVPEDKVEECKKIVQHLMENTTKLSVKLKAPPVESHNWKDGH
jgi:DNA polymerase I-like protein with 3'-5' exonuclease and polymerase domains